MSGITTAREIDELKRQIADLVEHARRLEGNYRKAGDIDLADQYAEFAATITSLAKERDELKAMLRWPVYADLVARAEAAEQALAAERARHETTDNALVKEMKEVERLRNLLMKAKGH